jgi:hypothetical protein
LFDNPGLFVSGDAEEEEVADGWRLQANTKQASNANTNNETDNVLCMENSS